MDMCLQIEPEKAVANPFGGGMDWLEVRLPQTVPFRPRVREAIASYRDGERSAFSPSKDYAAVVDLRKFDIADAFLHLGKKHQGEHGHKMQLVGAGQYSWGQHMADIEAVVDTDPMLLQPMRTDLTVDVDNVPMSWVLNHARVSGKRFSAQYRDAQSEQSLVMGMRELQTAYSGKRPNCFRVYDKKTERLQSYRGMTRGWHPKEPKWKEWIARASLQQAPTPKEIAELGEMFDTARAAWLRKIAEIGPKPTFREFCGLEEDQVLTRFERQIGAQQVGKLYRVGDDLKRPIFSTLGALKRNVADFSPFANMSFTSPGLAEPTPPNGSNYSLLTYMAGMWFRERVLSQGMQAAQAWATPLAKGHMKDVLAQLAPFMPAAQSEVIDISGAGLYERYRTAISKQLAA